MYVHRLLVPFFVFVLASAFLLLPACSSVVPPTVTWGPLAPIAGEPTVSLTANRQLPRIQQSLRSAGLTPAVDAAEGEYALQVKVGMSRSTKPCGTMHNVAYLLRGRAGRVLVIKGRGLTGTCSPNIFDDMSQTLASFFQRSG